MTKPIRNMISCVRKCSGEFKIHSTLAIYTRRCVTRDKHNISSMMSLHSDSESRIMQINKECICNLIFEVNT